MHNDKPSITKRPYIAVNLHRENSMKRRYHSKFRVETNAGRIVAHCDTIEQAEYHASKGRGRWVFRWFDGQYCCARQYNA